MVIHDSEQQQQWEEKRREQSEKKQTVSAKPPRRLSVIAVQSLACAVLLLAAVLLRVAGGPAYAGLQQRFYDALAGNELVSVWMKLWDPEPFDAELDVKSDDFTSAQPLE